MNTGAEILVLAPRFPSINQPWMDTYLEHLQLNGLRFCVVTGSPAYDRYHEKVDRLGLLEHTIALRLDIRTALLSCLAYLARRPVEFARATRLAWQNFPREESPRNKLMLWVRDLHVCHKLRDLRSLQLVHAHSIGFGYHFVTVARLRRLPLVLTFHGLEPRGVPQVPKHRRQALFDLAARVLVNTAFAARQAEALGCPPGKITIIPQGLPLEDFPFHPKPAPDPSSCVEILSVGRFHRDKGQRYCLLALKRLVDAGLDVHWHFIGVGPDRKDLQRLASRLGVDSRVSLHEGVSPATWFRRCHLFVLASIASSKLERWVETQGVVLQEAQASGCIPIATRVGGIPECINDGADGIVVRDKSHRAISTAIRNLLARPGEWQRLQANGRKNVEHRFAAEVIGREMAAILRTVADGRANSSMTE